MRARLEHFLAFFIKTFLLANFIFGSLGYVFAANRSNPGLEPETMLWIAVATAICGLIITLRETAGSMFSGKTEVSIPNSDVFVGLRPKHSQE